MASFAYTNFKEELLLGNINLGGSGDDIRVLLVMSNTTADTDEDVDTIDAISTLDEMDGSGYSRQALTNEAVSEDETNDRGKFDADDVDFGAVSNGTRQVTGAIVYKHVTDDTDSIPLLYIDDGGFPFNPGGSNVTLQWNANGILLLT